MPSILNATTTNGLVTSADNSGSLQLQTNNGTTAVTIDTSQNVGIGSTSPTAKLSIKNPSVSNEQYVFDVLGATNQTRLLYASVNQTTDVNNIGTGYAAPLAFVTNSTERMRIDSSGNLLVGRTATGLTNAGGGINKNAGGAYLEMVQGSNGVACAYFNQSNGTGTQTAVDFRYNNTQVGTINVTSTATTYVTSSDYRLKENISPMVGALDIVQQLKPVTYNWKADGSAGQGFIAHELAEVVPDCVTGEKDAVETYTDEDGNEQTRPKYQGIDTSFLVATLTAAIQELKAELDATKAEVQALKGVA